MADRGGAVTASQRSFPGDLADMEAWIRANAVPGQRILEIGCGDAALLERLADDFDVVGVDPAAEQSASVRRQKFEDLDERPFDLVFASVSMHHLSDPAEAVTALRRLTKPAAIMLIREFDRIAMDHRPTLEWWFDRRTKFTNAAADDEPMPATLEDFLVVWREDMEHHVLPWEQVRGMFIAAGFETVAEEPAASLFRWGLSEAHREEEERLAGEGTIRLVGRRWVGRRTS